MLKIGMELMIELENENEIEKYKTKIADIEEDHVCIQYPIKLDTEKTSFLPTGRKLYANFVGDGTSAYVFETEVIGRVKRNIPLMMIHYPGDDQLLKIQRREFVRIETAVDIALEIPEDAHTIPTTTLDISAGGCAAVLPERAQLSGLDLGWVHIVLPMQNGEQVYLSLQSKVVRIFEKKNIRIASLQFVNVDDAAQQHLIRFCFDRQLEYKRKGLITPIS